MINCMCVVQEGQGPDQSKAAMLELLSSFTTSSFGQEVQVEWIPVAVGNGFTAGELSTSSVIAITAHEALTSERRESCLRELVHLWTRKTGCSIDEVVAVISDPATH